MLLCDAAQEANGKLFILGGGWSIMGPAPGPMAIAIKLEVPWAATNERHTFTVRLLDADGQPFVLESDEGPLAIEMGGEFEVGRPPELPAGTPIDVPLAMNIGPLPLPPGRRWEWRLEIDGESHEDWHLSFLTRG